MSWVCQFSVVTPLVATIYTDNFHKKGYLPLHYLTGATIHALAANLINYNCRPLKDGRPLEDGNKEETHTEELISRTKLIRHIKVAVQGTR